VNYLSSKIFRTLFKLLQVSKIGMGLGKSHGKMDSNSVMDSDMLEKLEVVPDASLDNIITDLEDIPYFLFNQIILKEVLIILSKSNS